MEDNKVVGVRATHDGKELTVSAPSVVVTTGGFLPVEEMVQKYYPAYSREKFGGFMIKTNTGDGIPLVENAGGATENYITLIREGCAASDRAPRMLTEFVREPYHMWVNKKGERFVEETAGAELQIMTNALMMQPDVKAFAIFDDDCMQYMSEHGFELSKADDTRGTAMPDLREQLKSMAEKAPDAAIVADSLDEIAEWIGCRPEALKEEVSNYNRYCAQGYDEDFNKQRKYLRPVQNGPFYCIMHAGICVDTVGPVRINHRAEVLNADYDPIEGLYAGGVITSGWQSNDYCGQYLFGSALSYSINIGRIAGKNAAVHAQKK
jgi:fumarate reductase flavoprotein subunit